MDHTTTLTKNSNDEKLRNSGAPCMEEVASYAGRKAEDAMLYVDYEAEDAALYVGHKTTEDASAGPGNLRLVFGPFMFTGNRETEYELH